MTRPPVLAAQSRAGTSLASDPEEPPPAGEVAVLWGAPVLRHIGVKIRTQPRLSASVLGEFKGDTAIALRVPQAGKPPPQGGGCHTWYAALPDGYACASELHVKRGYLSSPPPQEDATRWQHLRYGTVRTPTAVLQTGRGQPASQASAGYLRSVLHRGDGVTVVRQEDDRVQLASHGWLSKADVDLMTPPDLIPVNLRALPVGQRLMVAWVVPPLGEHEAHLQRLAPNQPSVPVPRYTMLYWSGIDEPSGQATVHLSPAARALLQGHPAAQEPTFHIAASHLRRITKPSLPADLRPDEPWVDLSLPEQVAVAYIGQQPQFAALVSTGKGGATPSGDFRVYRKYRTQTMANLRGSASQYDFREVPYAQFFHGRIGLHAVLWHDRLGFPVSHGCVNMSPATAAQFFDFTEPPLPGGWHVINSVGRSQRTATRVVVRR